ncbi:hypothetical protein EVAR_25294_1 [Eumeta japonica]|uniref:Uncharacterized protein n=1 Tax=Eumeta variegata TaxID=151549 RepID=A0A4C1VPW0_EUMVA|nr:hypothetical protein EVAR_25294_1 [Eumeta japonica]
MNYLLVQSRGGIRRNVIIPMQNDTEYPRDVINFSYDSNYSAQEVCRLDECRRGHSDIGAGESSCPRPAGCAGAAEAGGARNQFLIRGRVSQDPSFEPASARFSGFLNWHNATGRGSRARRARRGPAPHCHAANSISLDSMTLLSSAEFLYVAAVYNRSQSTACADKQTLVTFEGGVPTLPEAQGAGVTYEPHLSRPLVSGGRYGMEDLLLPHSRASSRRGCDPTDPVVMAPFREPDSWSFPESAGDPEEVSMDSPSTPRPSRPALGVYKEVPNGGFATGRPRPPLISYRPRPAAAPRRSRNIGQDRRVPAAGGRFALDLNQNRLDFPRNHNDSVNTTPLPGACVVWSITMRTERTSKIAAPTEPPMCDTHSDSKVHVPLDPPSVDRDHALKPSGRMAFGDRRRSSALVCGRRRRPTPELQMLIKREELKS